MAPLSPRSIFLERNGPIVGLSLVGLCAIAWLYLIHLARQMEAMDGLAARMMGMPVEDAMSRLFAAALSPSAAVYAEGATNFLLLSLMWSVMMVGMMLPSAAPTILLFSALERKRATVSARGAFFLAGYLLAWSLFSVVAAAVQVALAKVGLLAMDMATTSTLLAGLLFAAGGAYELTPAKRRCLTHCRSPFTWIPQHMRPGKTGALYMGLEHGAYCVGCCWAVMILLFVGGVMNLAWVAAITVLILAQKLMPRGRLFSRMSGIALLVGGAALIAHGVAFAS